jgi:hypothetical protein
MKKEENGIAGPLVGTTQEIQEVKKSLKTKVRESIQQDQYTHLLKFNEHLSTAPKPEWIKVNKFSDNAQYLPIRKIEDLLRSFFGTYQVEMIGQPHILGNSVVISVHLKVFHPILREWLTYAGTGAVPIELEKGATPLQFELIKAKGLHKNIPAAKAYAISNAAKSIGRVFGSDLNNDETSEIYNVYGL